MATHFKPVPVTTAVYREYVPSPCTAYRFIYGQTPPPWKAADIYAVGVTYEPRNPVCTSPERMWPTIGEAGYRNRAEKSSWSPHRRKGARTGEKGVTLRDHRGAAIDRRSAILTSLVSE